MKPKVAVIRFPGSNCDRDTVQAFQSLGAETTILAYDREDLEDATHVVLPGGFSYGDYLRAGALAAHAPIMQALVDAIGRGAIAVLGICNGFQILCERGILPGALFANVSGQFRCSWEWVEVLTPPARWPGFRRGMRFRLPIAHADGAYRIGHSDREALWAQGSVFLRYVDPEGQGTDEYNPNGSWEAIAGISDGPVMGLMPHPERAMQPWLGSKDGRLFLSLWLQEVPQ